MPSSLHVLPLLLISLLASACAAAPTELGEQPDASRQRDAPMPDAFGADAFQPPDAAAPMCPPTGPYGRRVGDIAPDVMLTDCDGVVHSLHELCAKQVTWLFEFADWCPPCRTFAMSRANDIYDANVRDHGDAFAGWMVISQTASFGEPTVDDCAMIRDRYGIHMPVLIDPSGALQTALGVAPNEVNIVLTEGARLHWIGRFAGSEVSSRITSAY